MFSIQNVFDIAWTSLVAYSMVQGYLLFLLFLFYRNGEKQAKRLFAFASLICALILTSALLEITVGFQTLPHLIFAVSPLWYLLAPLLFLYIRLYTQNISVSWGDVWHIIPALFVMMNTMEFYMLGGSYKLDFIKTSALGYTHPIQNLNFIIFSLQSTFYFTRSWILLKEIQKDEHREKQHQTLIQLIIGLGFITALSFLSLFILNWETRIISWSGSLYILWLSVFLLILFLKSFWSPKELFFTRKTVIKFNGSSIQSQKDYETLLQYVRDERPYRNAQYDIQSLANQLGHSKNYINQVIKEYSNLNFKNFINSYRVKEAKNKLTSSHCKQFTIQSIAIDAGFTSLATFYRAFKKIEGTTPKTFLQQ